ncbi:MAG: hypothetical protein NT041_00645, partial [Candidatus Vogelbacteria bacterium]|nr:hypothetical protein [Candidatus Vogelbacteria bacterium]
MKPFLKLSLLIFLTLCLFPLTSLAQTAISVGTGTLQPDGKNFIYNTCQAPTPGTIDLSWKLPSTSFTNKDKYICTIGCNRYDAQGTAHDCAIPQEITDYCSKASKPCGANWATGAQGTGNSYVRKIGQIARYDYPDNSWNIRPSALASKALSTYDHNVANLLLQDQATTTDVYPGNTYQVSCSGPKRGKPTEIITVSSPRVTVQSNCGEACEVGFGEIVNKLDNNQVTPITEVDFRSWATPDNTDHVNWPSSVGPGSGDEENVESEIIKAHLCTGDPDVSGLRGNFAFQEIKRRLADSKSFSISLALRENLSTGHSLIILETIRPGGERTLFGTKGIAVDLKVLDPNGPKIVTIPCTIMKIDDSINSGTGICAY